MYVKFQTTLGHTAGVVVALAIAVVPNLQAAQRKQPAPAQKTQPAAAQSGTRERPQFNLAEKTSEALQKLGPLQQQKPPAYQEMLNVVDGVLATVPPTSYDAAFLLNIKAKVLLGMDKYGAAIPVWEQAVKLSDEHGYLDPKEVNEVVFYLAQLIFSEAATIKNTAQQQQLVQRSAAYLKRHLDNSPKPSLETQMFYAQLLYQQAVADPNKVNKDMLRQAREVIERSMQATLQPKEGFYLLLMAILQQENDMQRSAEVLELFLKKFPQKKDYWQPLMATYLNIAASEPDEVRKRDLYIRAINTLERAQKLGFLQTPKDNYNLVTLYLTAGQFSMATDILHAGLKKGTIESSLANWRLLGSYYQQANKDLLAIEALKEAAKLYPKEGMVDLHVGEIYRQMEKTKEAREFYRSALKKGNLEKPQVAYQLLAFTSMELDDWDEALRAINEAAKHPDFAKDQQMVNLKKHIEETVAIREEAKKDEGKKKKTATL